MKHSIRLLAIASEMTRADIDPLPDDMIHRNELIGSVAAGWDGSESDVIDLPCDVTHPVPFSLHGQDR